MAMKIDTDVMDYMVNSGVTLGNDVRCINVLKTKKDDSRAVMAIDSRDNLCCYLESEGEGYQFECHNIYENCSQYAAIRMGDSDNFAILLISDKKVYTCFVDDFCKIISEEFHELEGLPYDEGMEPVGVYANGNDKHTSFIILLKNINGLLKQYIADFSVDEMISIRDFSLAENFNSIICSLSGRAGGQPVDGVYTFGTYSDSEQLLYTPEVNIYGDSLPTPIRLGVPESGIECIETCKSIKNDETHLVAAGNGGLYFYDSDKQHDCNRVDYPNYRKIGDSQYFYGIKKISSYVDDHNKLYIWILNKNGNMYYVFAPVDKEGMVGDFVEPIRYQAEEIDDFDIFENTMTLKVDDKFMFGTRNEAGGYSFRQVLIKSDKALPVRQKVFSTRIQIDDDVEMVRIQTEQPIEAYINNKYYHFKDITVEPDVFHGINILQNAVDMTPATFNITEITKSVDKKGKTQSYFPGKKAYDKLLDLDTPEKLKNAYSLDQKGNKVYLAGSLTDEQIKFGADVIKQLSCNYRSIMQSHGENEFEYGVSDFALSWKDVIYYVKEAFDVVSDAAEKFWNNTLGKVIEFSSYIVDKIIYFTIKIGEQVLSFVLNSVGKILECCVKILEFVGIPVTDIFKFLLTYLDIEGTLRLHRAFKSVIDDADKTVINMNNIIRKDFKNLVDEIIEKIDKYDNKETLPVPDVEKKENQYFTPSSMMLYEEVFGVGNLLNANIEVAFSDDFLNLYSTDCFSEEQKEILEIIKNKLVYYKERIINCKTLSDYIELFKDILKEITIMTLNLAKDACDLLFDILNEGIESVWNVITQNRYIPIVSEIMESYGIKEISLTDVLFLPFAFMTNLIYYTFNGKSLISEEDLNVFLQETEKINWKADLDTAVKFKASDNSIEGKMVTSMVCHSILGVTSLIDMVINCVSVPMPGSYKFKEETNSSFICNVPTLISLGSSMVNYAASLTNSIKGYPPMPYFETEVVNIMWHINSISSILVGISDCVGLKLKKVEKFNESLHFFTDIMCFVGNGIGGFAQTYYMIIAHKQEDNCDESERHSEEFYKKDRELYYLEGTSYAASDFSSMVVFVTQNAKDFDEEPISKGIIIATGILVCCILGCGGAATMFASLKTLDDLRGIVSNE